jgi:hypothetical protein
MQCKKKGINVLCTGSLKNILFSMIFSNIRQYDIFKMAEIMLKFYKSYKLFSEIFPNLTKPGSHSLQKLTKKQNGRWDQNGGNKILIKSKKKISIPFCLKNFFKILFWQTSINFLLIFESSYIKHFWYDHIGSLHIFADTLY